MTKTIVMIHGMWAGPWCWDNFKNFFEQKGYKCYTPVLRHHDIDPNDKPTSGNSRKCKIQFYLLNLVLKHAKKSYTRPFPPIEINTKEKL